MNLRANESNICVSSRAGKPADAMKVTAGMLTPATDLYSQGGVINGRLSLLLHSIDEFGKRLGPTCGLDDGHLIRLQNVRVQS